MSTAPFARRLALCCLIASPVLANPPGGVADAAPRSVESTIAAATPAIPTDAALLAHFDLAAIAADPRLAALGLEQFAAQLGSFGEAAASLGADTRTLTVAVWPGDEANPKSSNFALLATGSYDLARLQQALGPELASATTLHGLPVLALTVESVPEPVYLQVLDEDHARMGTGEGLRRWMQSVAMNTDEPAEAATGSPTDGAVAWVEVGESLLRAGPGAVSPVGSPALTAGLTGLSLAVHATETVDLHARVAHGAAAEAQKLAAMGQLLPALVASAGVAQLTAIAGKLRWSVEGSAVVADLSLDANELLILSTVARALVEQGQARAAQEVVSPVEGADGAP